MHEKELATVSILYHASAELFYARNAFATGGVYEDPATGAAAAALAGYLRDIGYVSENNRFTVIQGKEMGCESHIDVRYSDDKGSGVWVSGETHHLD